MADLPLVILPHPLSSKAEDVIRRLAAETLDEVEYALAGPVDGLSARYHQRVVSLERTPLPGSEPTT